jgi:hypothetical protein
VLLLSRGGHTMSNMHKQMVGPPTTGSTVVVHCHATCSGLVVLQKCRMAFNRCASAGGRPCRVVQAAVGLHR